MIQFKLLNSEATVPERKTPGVAGFDLSSATNVWIEPGELTPVPTGVAMSIPKSHVGLIWPRSGFSIDFRTDVLAGVIDSDYTGEMHVAVMNHSDRPLHIRPGMRIGQLIVQRCVLDAEVVDDLPETTRGTKGFGHTGY